MNVRYASVVLLGLSLGCGAASASKTDSHPLSHPPPPPPIPASADPLGAKPEPAVPAAFVPPTPEVYTLGNGLSVWLLERHALPIVAVNLVVRRGAASDPPGKGGLAKATAAMLDEGAGPRGSLDIARDIDLLGATLHTGAYADYSIVALQSLKKNAAAAMEIFGDVVTKPTFSPKEWARTHALLLADLKSREKDPEEVSETISLRTLFSSTHPYGHPNNGTAKSVAQFSLADAKRFYQSM